MLEENCHDGSLKLWLATFGEMFFDEEVSAVFGVRAGQNARAARKEPAVRPPDPSEADYGFGTHRVPLEHNYLEAYLRDNVELVAAAQPDRPIVPEGIQIADGTVHELDVIILATGFDAGTGALTRIDIRGRDGRSLKEGGRRHPHHDGAAGARLSQPVHHRRAARAVGRAVQHDDLPAAAGRVDQRVHRLCAGERQDVVEPTKEGEDDWVEHHEETAAATLVVKTNSWYMGSNVEGKPRRLLSYIGGVGNYKRKCDELAANGYQGFAMT